MNRIVTRLGRAICRDLLTMAYMAIGAATASHGQCPTGHMFASDGAASDNFGRCVALWGDTAVVGSPHDNMNTGSAYVFIRAGGVWFEQARLFASDGLANDQFGTAVAISGDTIVVGAPNDSTAAGESSGSVYVFVRNDDIWTVEAQFVADDAADADSFGSSVALDGDTAIVGAPSDDTPANNAGSAYVFVRSAGVWAQQAHLIAPDGGTFDLFGFRTAISGDTVIVGVSRDDTPAGGNAGSAFVFLRTGSDWTQQAQLFASDGADSDFFGSSVGIDGDTAVVGAASDDTPAGTAAGSAYIFERSGVTWTQQAQLFASDGAPSALFGNSIAVSGDTIVVGADRGGTGAGSACAFVRDTGIWTTRAEFLPLDGDLEDRFGVAVAISGDAVIVGAVWDDTSEGVDAGSAYLFELACCPGDVDGNGSVDLGDLAILLAHFGMIDGAAMADGDSDADQDVDLADLSSILSRFGTSCP